MAATPDSIQVTPGSGPKVAIYDFTESAATKILQRVALSDPYGNPLSLGAPSVAWAAIPQVSIDSSYGANWVLGGVIPFENVFGSTGSGVIRTVRVVTDKVLTANFTLFIFNANPTSSTFNDNALAVINSADALNVVLAISLSPINLLGTHTIASTTVDAAIDVNGANFYCVLVTNDILSNQFSTQGDLVLELVVTADVSP